LAPQGYCARGRAGYLWLARVGGGRRDLDPADGLDVVPERSGDAGEHHDREAVADRVYGFTKPVGHQFLAELFSQCQPESERVG
jgi:hypothetical protein